MMADDRGKEWVGCYGGEGNHTPNIDKLAATGMTFDNAYSMPKCVASRMTLMTGQDPARNGYVDHWEIQRGSDFLDPRKNPFWPLVMRQGGYKTCAVGKWQLTIPGRENLFQVYGSSKLDACYCAAAGFFATALILMHIRISLGESLKCTSSMKL